MLFKKVAPFTVRDVGCRPIFHLRLKGGYLQPEKKSCKSFLLIKQMHAGLCVSASGLLITMWIVVIFGGLNDAQQLKYTAI